MKLKCKIVCQHLNPHLQQIYTGYISLQKRGFIDLSIITPGFNRFDRITSRIPYGQHPANLKHPQQLDVYINDRTHLHYDTQDGFAFDHDALETCDFYFKRSYFPAYIDTLSNNNEKILPLGLNYNVFPDSIDWSFINGFLKSIDKYNLIKYVPRQHQMEALPDYDAEPRILFMATAYDPFDKQDRPKNEIEARVSINDTRAKCISLLRDHFGSKFFGGFMINKYTASSYADYLLEDRKISRKSSYLKTMKSYPICVATTGLHNSTGWKFAEYIACSRAILSEKLNYEVPGTFGKNRNYIEFNSPDECVDMADKLFKDRELRSEIMSNNAQYYMQWLRPDNMILNTILMALSRT